MAGFRIKRESFTLIEMMLVVVILAMIVTLSAPSFHRSKISANEQAAIAALKNLYTAVETYREVYSINPANLSVMATDTAPLIPSAYLTGCNNTSAPHYQGYQFCYAPVTNTTIYTVNASPLVANSTGVRIFRIRQTGIIEELRGTNWTSLE